LIKVENLTKKYAGLTAVDSISFNVQKNEILGFLGPNGAGKSTTLKILTGFLNATSGSVTIDGHDVFEKPESVKRIIGYLPENVPLYPELRVKEYLSYRAALKRVPRSKKKSAIGSAIERCKLAEVQDRIIGQLSKGYRQRVGLADTLVGDPKILILDEPTIGLDPNQIRQVRDLVQELGQERTVILSSHILPEVEAVCSSVQIIHRGRLVSQGRPDELRANLEKAGVSILVEVRDPNGVSIKAIENVEGIQEVGQPNPLEDSKFSLILRADEDELVRERIFDAAVQSGFKLLSLSSKRASLEDVFVELTTREDALENHVNPAPEGGAK
jgi:ABC-2 type transport system ATP-binding protein